MSRTKLRTGILIDRIKEEIGLEKDTELADLLGKAQNTISTWRIRNSRLPIDQLIPKCDDLGIKIDWNYVIYGEHGRVSVGMQPYNEYRCSWFRLRPARRHRRTIMSNKC
ncbi:MAG: helix-turn-helix domain-containing protein [Chlorobi bacterium]|nr:helix-turn-helix domain-containing protein [Chlorobiota bacterium]